MDQTEFERSQASTWEESETVLQERQTNSNENKAGSEKERGGGLFDMGTSAGEKESVGLPGHSDLRRESGVCQKPDSSEKQEANDPCVIPVTRARCSQTEQRHRSAEKVMDIMTESAVVVLVDYCELKQLLDMVTDLTKEADIFYFEKLYTKICQCIYQHQDDYDKTKLLKVIFVL
ncbi:ATPase family AAA domain-containing protein 2-like [Lagopus leucura]|uniref:ATPase family AAA domain-containing protein 2-like n=1 Tax=Lagopus leucura TaxID=30410 RepID=UPI001C666DE2|nr:ATPase family AAA domain-containing protein 2-like [Lagopus leucura]